MVTRVVSREELGCEIGTVELQREEKEREEEAGFTF